MFEGNETTDNLWKKKFSIVKNGLDQDEVFSFINELMGKNSELSTKLDHLDSLRMLAEKTVVEANKLAQSIKEDAQEQANTQAASIINEAEEKAFESFSIDQLTSVLHRIENEKKEDDAKKVVVEPITSTMETEQKKDALKKLKEINKSTYEELERLAKSKNLKLEDILGD